MSKKIDRQKMYFITLHFENTNEDYVFCIRDIYKIDKQQVLM